MVSGPAAGNRGLTYGDIFVVRAGPTFELIATNSMGQPLMATPAIADGLLIVRGERDRLAVGAVTRR